MSQLRRALFAPALPMLHVVWIVVALGAATPSSSASEGNNTKAVLKGSRLVLTVEGLNTQVLDLTNGSGAGALTVAPSVGNCINGLAKAASFEGVKSIALKGENVILDLDTLSLDGGLKVSTGGVLNLRADNVELGGNVKIYTAGEADVDFSASTIDGKVSVRTKSDVGGLLFEEGCLVRGNVSLRGKDGTLNFFLFDSELRKNLSVKARDGNAGCAVTTASAIEGNLSFKLRDGDPLLVISTNARVEGRVSCVVRDGDAEVQLLSAARLNGDVLIKARNGDNQVRLQDEALVQGKLYVKCGKGENLILMSDEALLFGRVKIATGSGPDFVQIGDGSLLEDSVSLKLGDGANTLRFDDVSLDGDLSYKGGRDVDDLAFTDFFMVSTGKGVRIDLGKGDNQIVCFEPTAFDSDVRVKSGNGDDLVDFLESSITGTFTAKLGKGRDTLVEPAGS